MVFIVRVRSNTGMVRIALDKEAMCTVHELKLAIQEQCDIAPADQLIQRHRAHWYDNDQENNDKKHGDAFSQDDFTMEQLNVKHGDILVVDRTSTEQDIPASPIPANTPSDPFDPPDKPLRLDSAAIWSGEAPSPSPILGENGGEVMSKLSLAKRELSAVLLAMKQHDDQQHMAALQRVLDTVNDVTTTMQPQALGCTDTNNNANQSDDDEEEATAKPISASLTREEELEQQLAEAKRRFERLRVKAKKMNKAGMLMQKELESQAVAHARKIRRRDDMIRQLSQEVQQQEQKLYQPSAPKSSRSRERSPRTGKPAHGPYLKPLNTTYLDKRRNSGERVVKGNYRDDANF